ncbi:MAG: 16S rRNA (uracil(1498)-N(3))-methyltransferase [Proteobacteria bacterium]|nr:16S rRNA (uracil(1498)-N(3))-methyltransferase [Pseudomonadota bacterium]HQR03092.1 16S rRNA (uracil(1498)-N(3))-methyltransferase [Rhodocyclaceae bacterium]
MIPRFHCPALLAPGALVPLPPDAAHHAVHVLRLTAGAPLLLFDGRGGQWQARLERLKPHPVATLEIFDAEDRESPIQVTLMQSIPSGDKMDWVVQKAVELGVSALQPVAAHRSVIRLAGERMEKRRQHWQSVAISACEQCGRNRTPVVGPILDLPQALAATGSDNDTRLILLPEGGGRLRELSAPATPISLLIGPEGGFEEGEIRAALAAGFRPITLGPRILRTETAGPAALAAILALWGDM